MRAPGQRADGTYSASASKTIATTTKKAYDAFASDDIRSNWLGDHPWELGTVRVGKSLTARWEDGTRLYVSFEPKDKGKVQVALAHERIPEASRADQMKLFWREHLGFLKKVLEG
ncbi:MAG TPA: hypothetical protein VNP73_11655 [Actinomycetota bacterium]|nr:hypothetical protein [Actinomycetota bacterium]